MVAQKKTRGYQQRGKWKEEFWPGEEAWTGEDEKGWFRAPRTLPLVLQLLASKQLSGNIDPSSVYLELLARHIDNGIVEMAHEADHAFAAGYVGSRAVRTWQERMKMLEDFGFIRTKKIGNRFKYVLIVHPTVAIQRLNERKKISPQWWDTYRARQIETKEALFEDRKLPTGAASAASASAS
jgi:hypothetical protein